MTRSTDTLFTPFTFKGLTLPNRIVMAPMTRAKSPGRIPGPDVAAYYKRRAEGGVGLIVSEGTFVPHPSAGFDAAVPDFGGAAALAGWKCVIDGVHAAGGKFAPQLWHVGMQVMGHQFLPGEVAMGPGNMSLRDIQETVKAYGVAAKSAKELGCDALEVHAAHGYLIDQFFWEGTNQRTDEYGGSIEARTKFAVDVVNEIRRNVGPEYPVILRVSQFKISELNAKLAHTPGELEQLLAPLVKAGVDLFHCSQRRFWEAEFEGSNLNLAGWTKKITGKPTITVGSVTLNEEFMTSFRTDTSSNITGLDELLNRLERGDFDLVAVGRALIANPDWAARVKGEGVEHLHPFHRSLLAELA